MIIYEATRYVRNRRKILSVMSSSMIHAPISKRRSEMTRTILTITFAYIMFTLPSSIVNGYFYVPLMNLEYGELVVNIVGCVNFTFPVLNFFALLYSNKMFAYEFKSLRNKRSNNQVTPSLSAEVISQTDSETIMKRRIDLKLKQTNNILNKSFVHSENIKF